ncbi:MAG TPA: signal peptidase I [Candidatus Limnocylindrales bacterium]|nr:signal peptidase I [Candidatus Limnocylindrales bacterium]
MRVPRLRDVPLFFGVAVLAAWFVLLRPTSLGGPAGYLWVNGTSMEPTLASGDLVVVRQQGAYGPGDIVGFRVPDGEPGAGALVIHRIVGGSASDGFVTQGDNKPRPDEWRPTGADVVGAQWFVLPGAGPAITFVRQPAVFAALAAAAVVFLVMAGGTNDVRRRAVGVLSTPSSARYRWTPERGLAVCGAASRASRGLTALAATPPSVDRRPHAAPYRWTLERGIAVCGVPGSRARGVT